MRLKDLLANERELLLRSLAFTGIKVIVPLSVNNRFRLSEIDLEDQEIQEIHILDEPYDGMIDNLLEIGFAKKGNVGKWQIFIAPDEVLNESEFSGSFEIGDLLICNFGAEVGRKAIVYSKDSDGDINVITESGEHITCMSERTALNNFIFIKKTNFQKEFTVLETIQIRIHFMKGKLKKYFQ